VFKRGKGTMDKTQLYFTDDDFDGPVKVSGPDILLRRIFSAVLQLVREPVNPHRNKRI
jgi:hypothetical protein